MASSQEDRTKTIENQELDEKFVDAKRVKPLEKHEIPDVLELIGYNTLEEAKADNITDDVLLWAWNQYYPFL